MSIVLTGYRGSGKTTVGRRVAQRLGVPFVDCDERIVARAGKPIRRIFAEQGEGEFRKLETAVIADAAAMPNGVIAVGGGALMQKENRRVLAGKGHQIIYLRCDPKELLRRIQADPATSDNRPNLTGLGGGIEEIETLLSQREPIYRAAMSIELDVTRLTPEQAAARIVRETRMTKPETRTNAANQNGETRNQNQIRNQNDE